MKDQKFNPVKQLTQAKKQFDAKNIVTALTEQKEKNNLVDVLFDDFIKELKSDYGLLTQARSERRKFKIVVEWIKAELLANEYETDLAEFAVKLCGNFKMMKLFALMLMPDNSTLANLMPKYEPNGKKTSSDIDLIMFLIPFTKERLDKQAREKKLKRPNIKDAIYETVERLGEQKAFRDKYKKEKPDEDQIYEIWKKRKKKYLEIYSEITHQKK